jgi:structural maintenance of chromosome 3 (chondroitin sulfate proteoglycan 6)
MVAKLVRNQADEQGEKCQIFCTTFKPEILEVADNFYRITVKNEASRIDKMDKEEAMEFVEARQNENQINV